MNTLEEIASTLVVFPAKALIHVSRIVHQGKKAEQFGYTVSGNPDIAMAMEYVLSTQDIIRKRENGEYLCGQSLDVVLGLSSFHSTYSVIVGDTL